MSNQAVPEDVLNFKKRNDWLAILQHYHLQAMDNDMPSDLPLQEKGELLFAALHWADDIQSRAKSKTIAEQAMRAYFWVLDQSDKFAAENPDSFIALSQDAYAYYSIFLNANALRRMCKKLRVDDNVNRELGKRSVHLFENAKQKYEKLLAMHPDSINNQYRYAHLMRKELGMSDYKMSRSDLQNLHSLIAPAYQKTIQLYDAAENKAPYRKAFLHSLYDMACYLNDNCYEAFWFENCIRSFRAKEEIMIKEGTTRQGIPWALKDLRIAEWLMERYFDEVRYPENPSDSDIDRIAKEENFIVLPMYAYYRKAKIFFFMAVCWESGLKKIYKQRCDDVSVCIHKYEHYLELARKNCQWAVDIRFHRKAAGFTDAGGIFPECQLLAQIYTIDTNYRIEDIEKLVKMSHGDPLVKYYYAVAVFFLDKENGKSADRAIGLLDDIAKNTRLTSVAKKAKKMISDIQTRFA